MAALESGTSTDFGRSTDFSGSDPDTVGLSAGAGHGVGAAVPRHRGAGGAAPTLAADSKGTLGHGSAVSPSPRRAGESLMSTSMLSAPDFSATDYWRSWQSEVAATADETVRATQARAAHKAAAHAEATKGIRGVKLDAQWLWDHPFAFPTARGGTIGRKAFMDSDEPRLHRPERDYATEFRAQEWPRRIAGGIITNTGRLEMEKLYLGKEANKHYIEPSAVGPGSYDTQSGFGPQQLSTKRSAGTARIGASGRGGMRQYETDGPGPVYRPKDSPLVYGHVPSVKFSTAPRLPGGMTGHETPGPKYMLPVPRGPAFSIGRSSGGGIFASDDADLSSDDDGGKGGESTASTSPIRAPAGFGFGCSYEEHVKYGHCLDGQCSMRSNWEAIQTRTAGQAARAARGTTPARGREGGEVGGRGGGGVDGGPRDGGDGASTGGGDDAGSRADAARGHGGDAGVSEAHDRAVSAPAPAPGSASSSAAGTRPRGGSSRQSASRGHNSRPVSNARSSRARTAATNASGVTGFGALSTSSVGARYADVTQLPNLDVFPHTCVHCGTHVSLLTRMQRIAASNRRVQRRYDHIITPSHPVGASGEGTPGAATAGVRGRGSRGLGRDVSDVSSVGSGSYAESLPSTRMVRLGAPDASVAFTPRSEPGDPAASRAIDWPRRDAQGPGSVGGASLRSIRSVRPGGGGGGGSTSRGGSKRRGGGGGGTTRRSGRSASARAVPSGRRAGTGRAVDAEEDVSRIVHDPSRVVYLPGCGFFCSDEHIHLFVLATVGPGSGGRKSPVNRRRPAVLLTATDGRVAELSDLLTNASDVNIVDASNRTALHLAALGGHVAAMDRLLCGAFNVLNYQVCKRHHERPCACYNQNLEVNVFDDTGSTPLHLAAAAGHSVAVERLLRAGADPQLLDNDGRAPHDVASNQQCYHLCKNSTAMADTMDMLRGVQLKREAISRRLTSQ